MTGKVNRIKLDPVNGVTFRRVRLNPGKELTITAAAATSEAAVEALRRIASTIEHDVNLPPRVSVVIDVDAASVTDADAKTASPPEWVRTPIPMLAPKRPRTSPTVAVVLGTYNRLRFLQDAIHSVRRATGSLSYEIVVVDGGSVDGSRKWLNEQDDVVLIEQSGPLSGAVEAFNLGFAYAVDRSAEYIMHINDDCVIEGTDAILKASRILAADVKVGAVAFAFDLRGPWSHETVHGYIYVNFGLIRTEAGKAVARRQGDPTGRAWWNPIYRTYGADSEFGVWLHHIGWKIHAAHDLRVHDRASETNDELRRLNQSDNPDRPDSRLFWSRWLSQKNISTGPVTRGR